MFLKKGDLIDVICPASSITKNELRLIKNFLARNGFQSRFHLGSELLLNRKQSSSFPAFCAKKRFEQLRFAVENTESKAIWCVRGGYGSGDLIPFLEKMSKPAQNKLFIGFSDITSLAIFLEQKWNWKTIYGPMLTQLAKNQVSAASRKAVLDLISNKNSELKYNLNGPNKNIEAKLVGGCLSVLASHFATSNEISCKNQILFLEDIDESGERIDRYFTQLIQVMLLRQCLPQAILLGNFNQGVTKINKKRNINFALTNFSQRLRDAKLDIPIFIEKTNCLGHSKNIMPTVIGGQAKISNGNFVQKSVCVF